MKSLLVTIIIVFCLLHNSICIQISTDLELSWVKHFASGIKPSVDIVVAMDCDDFGNVYVTGNELNPFNEYNIVTIKYNPFGNQIWKMQYDDGENCRPISIKVDEIGNVYVSGVSMSTSDWDFITIKYNSFGLEEWVDLYNGPENGRDIVGDLEIDNSGCLYVSGSCRDSSRDESIISTIKYNPDGTRDWNAQYEGPEGSYNGASALNVDELGNVFITGRSNYNSSNNTITIKYNSQGNKEWVRTYNTGKYTSKPVNTIDSSGNVIVSGEKQFDFYTIKYNSYGAEQWKISYSTSNWVRLRAIAADEENNVYITGESDNGFITIKYSSSGSEKWIKQYKVPDGITEAFDIAVDTNGNAYVTGITGMLDTTYTLISTIKYSPSGDVNWSTDYYIEYLPITYPAKIVTNNTGDVFVSGTGGDISTREEFVTIKYDSLGQEQWISTHNGQGSYDSSPEAMAVDQYGNLYITGYDYGDDCYDYVTIKYNKEGVEQWIKRKTGLENAYADVWEMTNHPEALAVDLSGNIYITGYGSTIKYNSYGIEQWAIPSAYKALVLDDLGNVYVTGDSGHQYITSKYNSDGQRLWTKLYGNMGFLRSHHSKAIALGKSEDIYVTGYHTFGADPICWTTVKYKNDGTELWSVIYDSTYSETLSKLLFDDFENIYIAGTKYIDGKNAAVVIKYDSSGILQNEFIFNGNEYGDDFEEDGVDFAVDDTGNVYFTGTIYDGSDHNIVTSMSNAEGIQQWSSRYDGPDNSNDYSTKLIMDDSSNIYICGFSRNYTDDEDIFIIKYSSEGVEQWCKTYNGPRYIENSNDRLVDIALDDSNNVYLTGYSEGLYGKIFTTLKYSQSGEIVDIFHNSLSFLVEFKLSQNYPNPFNPSTKISFALPNQEHVTLEVYNPLGQKIETLLNKPVVAGNHQIEFNSKNLTSGIYFYRIEAGEFQQVKKMVLLK